MIEIIHQFVWGPWTLIFYLFVGIWLTCYFKGFQIRGISVWWKCTIGSLFERQIKGEITPFQTACTTLAATIGTGNIAGVATAITIGGPGAIFWMWVSAFLGMMTAYAETTLSQQYRYLENETGWICGPMVYMEKGIHSPKLGLLYAGLVAIGAFGMGNMVQANAISTTFSYYVQIPYQICGVVLVVLVGAILKGGIYRITKLTQQIVPISAGLYIVFACIILLSYWNYIPTIITLIVKDAFQISSATGGIVGFLCSKSLRYGLARGIFSNEAGLGTMGILHGDATHTTPQIQGMWAMFEVFFDTMVICTLTGFVILCVTTTGQIPNEYNGAVLTAYCFSKRLGWVGSMVIPMSMVLFAFATIVAWYHLGNRTLSYLLGKMKLEESKKSWITRGYLLCYLLAIYGGCIVKVEFVWVLADIWNGLMAIPNLITLFFLTKTIDKVL